MRVLHTAASLATEWGGPSRVVLSLAEALAQKGARVSIFAPGPPEDSQIVQPNGVEARVFPPGWLARGWKGYSPALAAGIDSAIKDFDLVHIHELWHYPHFAAYRAAVKAGKPYMITIHGALEPWAMNYKALKKRLYWRIIQHQALSKATVLHAFTKAEAEQIRKQGFQNPVVIIPNGVDIANFGALPPKQAFDNSYPTLARKRVILFLGRIHPIKGLDNLCKALAAVAKEPQFDDARLVIVGPDEGGYRATIETLLQSAGVLDKTIFTGMLTGSDKLAALTRADLFVLPSYSEGFSMAALEALACRTPIIITRTANFPEIAEVGAGEIVEPDKDQLADTIKRLLSAPDLLREMGEKGRQLVMDRYTWEKVAEQMMATYQYVADQTPRTESKKLT